MISTLFASLALSLTLTTNNTIVIEVNTNTDVVYVGDCDGQEYAFYGCEDWIQGDIAQLTMFGDVILDARYIGWVY